MTAPRVFNPDDYLWTPAGRVYTEERSAKAWEQLYSDLEMLFSVAAPEARFFLVMIMGLSHMDTLEPDLIGDSLALSQHLKWQRVSSRSQEAVDRVPYEYPA